MVLEIEPLICFIIPQCLSRACKSKYFRDRSPAFQCPAKETGRPNLNAIPGFGDLQDCAANCIMFSLAMLHTHLLLIVATMHTYAITNQLRSNTSATVTRRSSILNRLRLLPG